MQHQPIRTVAILIFEDVEVLDFAGPFEVFSVTAEINSGAFFSVQTIGVSTKAIRARNGLQVTADALYHEIARPDLLIVAGGNGTNFLLNDKALIDSIAACHASGSIVASVCSGARLLGLAGLLDGMEATTHHQVFDHLAALAPNARLRKDLRIVDTGSVITCGGISAGIDMSLHLVARLCGREIAERTADYMEYDWRSAES